MAKKKKEYLTVNRPGEYLSFFTLQVNVQEKPAFIYLACDAYSAYAYNTGVEMDQSPESVLKHIYPKSSLGNEDFALRLTKTLRIKVLSGADDKYQHGDLKRRSINPDIGNERFNFQNKLFKSFISTRWFGSSMRSIKNSIEFFGFIYLLNTRILYDTLIRDSPWY